MQKQLIELPTIKLVGITVRTNNALEMHPSTAKIGATIQQYFQNALPAKITHRKNPGVTYCVYTEYESDVTGDYTYFIGEEVESFEDVSADLKQLSIANQTYIKFTTDSGSMLKVCIKAWQEIWTMSPEILGGERSYIADFEVYDERASDLTPAVLDIYIGINRS